MLFKDMSDKTETNQSDSTINEELTPVQQIVANDKQLDEAKEIVDPNELTVRGQFGNEITDALKEVFAQTDVKVKDAEIVITSESIKEKAYIYSGNDNNLITSVLKAKDSNNYSKVAVYLSSENINNDTVIKFLNKEKIDVILTTNSLKQYLTSIQG